EFFAPWTSVVNAAEANPGRDWETTGGIIWTRRKEVWNRGVCNRKRIKRIRDRHTDASRTEEHASVPVLKWIRCKRHSRQGRIEKRARILEVGKHCQVLVANIAGEGAVVHLAVSRRQRRRESGEVKEEIVATALIVSAKLVKLLYWIVNTRCTWIGIWVNRIRALVKWRTSHVRR